jgi:hypothetical protein
MSYLFILIAIALTWKFLPAIFEFIIGLFIVHLVWQIIKLIFKFTLITGLILFILYMIVK